MDQSATAAAGRSGAHARGQERRRELRSRPAGGSARIDGVFYEVFDWSSSGLGVRGYHGALGEGDRTRVMVRITLPDRSLAFLCDLIVVRVDRKQKQLAGVFAALSRRDRVAIASHFEHVEDEADEGLRAATTAR